MKEVRFRFLITSHKNYSNIWSASDKWSFHCSNLLHVHSHNVWDKILFFINSHEFKYSLYRVKCQNLEIESVVEVIETPID